MGEALQRAKTRAVAPPRPGKIGNGKRKSRKKERRGAITILSDEDMVKSVAEERMKDYGNTMSGRELETILAECNDIVSFGAAGEHASVTKVRQFIIDAA